MTQQLLTSFFSVRTPQNILPLAQGIENDPLSADVVDAAQVLDETLSKRDQFINFMVERSRVIRELFESPEVGLYVERMFRVSRSILQWLNTNFKLPYIEDVYNAWEAVRETFEYEIFMGTYMDRNQAMRDGVALMLGVLDQPMFTLNRVFMQGYRNQRVDPEFYGIVRGVRRTQSQYDTYSLFGGTDTENQFYELWGTFTELRAFAKSVTTRSMDADFVAMRFRHSFVTGVSSY